MNILAIDIETAPNKVWTWGLWDQNIALNQVIETSRVLCFAAKWIGPDARGGVIFGSEWGDGREEMLIKVHDLMDEADVIVHWNGGSFDIPHLNREFVELGLVPPSPYQQIDLMRVVRRAFKFQSNKLEHVAQELLGHGKVKHEGFELWLRVMEGDEKAQRRMRKYNIQDTVLLDELYNVLLPWIPAHPNRAAHPGVGEHVCPRCGSPELSRRGFRRLSTGSYQQYQCNNCGGWSIDRKLAPHTPRPLRRAV